MAGYVDAWHAEERRASTLHRNPQQRTVTSASGRLVACGGGEEGAELGVKGLDAYNEESTGR